MPSRDVQPRGSVWIDAGKLFVGGRRRTILGGEIHNSNASSLEAMGDSLRRVKDLGADCVLAPIAWEQLEPQEGVFDTTLVDGLVRIAAELDLDVIPLWFGSWKNGMSTYVPAWIKTDPHSFPRALTAAGSIEALSPFAPRNRSADARAFAVLMQRLREQAAPGRVLMVQVENEVGILGDARDRSDLADACWADEVPSDVAEAVRSAPGSRAHAAWLAAGSRRQGTWSELFGDGPAGAEAFMAAAFARYVEHVAAAGRHALDVPLLVNAWQDADLDGDAPDPAGVMAGGHEPGSFPSGGPVRDVISIWRAIAPTIDLCVPDIYARDFEEIAEGYRARAGALFIPEMQRGPRSIGQMFWAIGEQGAFGVSPFGADSFSDAQRTLLRDAYDLLGAIAAELAARPDAPTCGVDLTLERPSAARSISDLELTVSLAGGPEERRPDSSGHAVIVGEGPGRILVAARGCLVAAAIDGRPAGILTATELRYDEGGATVVRHLNGDETMGGSAVRFPSASPGEDRGTVPVWRESTGVVRLEYYARG